MFPGKNSLTTKALQSLLMLFSLFVLSCSSVEEQEENVLAKIDNLSVTTTHFENAFKEYYYRTGQVLKPDISTKQAILNSQFNTYVLAVYAKDEGLHESEFALNKKKSIERRVLNEEYLQQVILKDVEVSDQQLREYFLRFNTQLRASHIYASTKEKIDEYYQRLQNGETFSSLAKEAFINPYFAENGGDIGRFTFDEMDVAFEDEAYSLKVGEISEPVQTAQGYSIIKLTERTSKPVITEFQFNQRRDQVYSYALKKEKELKTREHLNDFVSNSQISSKTMELLWDMFSSDYVSMLNKSPEFVANITNSDELISVDNFSFKVDDFVEEYLITSPEMLNIIQDYSSFEFFVKGVAYRSFLYEKALESKIGDQSLVKESIEETYLHYLADEATQRLRSEIVNTQAELYNEFQNNMEAFQKPLEVNVARIVLDSEEKAELVLNKLNDGESFSKLVEEYTIYNEDRFTQGELGFTSIKNFGFHSKRIGDLKEGQLSGIIQYQQNEFHIYKCLQRSEPEQLYFAQAKEEVDKYLTEKKLKTLRNQTIEEVKKKHEAVIDLQKLQELTIQI